MTGGEMLAGAAASTVAKTAKEDTKTKAALAELAKETAPMAMAAEEYAKRVAIRQAVYTKMMTPLARLFGIKSDYFDDGQFAEDMAEKTAHLSDEDLVEPKSNVAVQAIQGLGFSLEEPLLKEMYLNLLATASTVGNADKAHPSFADMIKQLAGSEAQLLSTILGQGNTPTCQLRIVEDGSQGWNLHSKHLLPWDDAEAGETASPELIGLWIDNWIRLGLVEVRYDEYVVGEGAYDWVETRPEYCDLAASLPEGKRVEVAKGHLTSTFLGRQFFEAVASVAPHVIVVPADGSLAPDSGAGAEGE